MALKLLLACGILSPLLFVAMKWLGAETLRWLQPGLANGQRVVCDRCPPETSLGLAGDCLLPAFRRVRMGRLEIS